MRPRTMTIAEETAVPDPKLRFRFREPTVDTNLPISDGTVKVEGFDLEVMQVGEDDRFEADARDEGFGTLLQRKVQDAPDVCIPAFPNRKFRLSYIYVNAAAGIDSPKDLEGKRVGIPAWGNTAGVWARGALQNYYEVDLTAIRWLSARPGAGSTAPGIEIGKLDGALDDMLVRTSEWVDEGDQLGTVGQTGSLIGPSLYFEVREGAEAVNPELWLRGR